MADSYVNINASLRPGELAQPIRISTNNLAAMAAKGADYIKYVAASSPVQLDSMFGVKTGVAADMALEAGMNARRAQFIGKTKTTESSGTMIPSIFGRGDVVYDTDHAKRVTVLKACVGYTKKGRPIHRVVDKAGNAWLVSERKLQKL